MECPVDHAVLQMTERQGVEIDYCPRCRGIWLDRGELDKIIDRAPDVAVPRPGDHGDEQHGSYDQQQRSSSYKKKRKESFLGELFDF
ncbi:MAG: zf-TFIIB domain-containing protein [Nocardioidaceae bacterium]|nr:zf-TFIIB domain-containing protein [Nocardioidaceae bacterium]